MVLDGLLVGVALQQESNDVPMERWTRIGMVERKRLMKEKRIGPG